MKAAPFYVQDSHEFYFRYAECVEKKLHIHYNRDSEVAYVTWCDGSCTPARVVQFNPTQLVEYLAEKQFVERELTERERQELLGRELAAEIEARKRPLTPNPFAALAAKLEQK